MSKEAILLAGEFHWDRLGSSYERAFKQIGHPVHRFDLASESDALAWPARNRVLHRLTIGSLSARRAWSKDFNHRLLQAAATCDAPWVFLHNGIWIMPETVRMLREQGRRVVIFHADNPYAPHYNHRPEGLLAACEADIYLIWSERLVAKLRGDGVNARFLAFGWDQELSQYQSNSPQGNWPGVVFIGNWDREREAFLDQIAACLPLRIYGADYWGTRAQRSGLARACWQGHALDLADAAKVSREAAVNLNILRTQHVIDGEPDGVIMRHFEVPGAGGFLLSTRSGTATRLFPEQDSGAYFTGAQECIDQCRRYIAEPGQRMDMVKAAHAVVSRRHRYLDRASEIVAMLRELDGSMRFFCRTQAK